MHAGASAQTLRSKLASILRIIITITIKLESFLVRTPKAFLGLRQRIVFENRVDRACQLEPIVFVLVGRRKALQPKRSSARALQVDVSINPSG